MTTESVAHDESDVTEPAEDPALDAGHGEPGHGEAEHRTDLFYVKIFVVLAVITGIEVTLSYIDMNTTLFLILMFAAMSAKFYIVAAYFMHLKTDNKLLQRLFYAGLFLAIGVYSAFLATLQVFD